MKIIFFGTPSFAANNLRSLIEKKNEIVAVVSAPDSKRGRGRKNQSTEVKKIALNYNIPVLQPLDLKESTFISKLESYNADLFMVVAFKLLPKLVWKIPRYGTVNLHTSYLPNYRGAAPINRVLINGEEETGVTTFFINEKIDAGEIIIQKKIYLSEHITAAQLHNILIIKGNILLEETVNKIKLGLSNPKKQNRKKEMKGAPKLTKDMTRINWSKSADDIHNLVRGISPYLDETSLLKDVAICPGAWFILEDEKKRKKRIKILLTKIVEKSTQKHLSICTDNNSYLTITVKNKALSILNLQVEGKKPVGIKQFLQGNKITNSFKIS